MKINTGITLTTLNAIYKLLNYTKETKPAIMNLNNNGRITTTLNIFHTPEGPVLLNISNTKTYQFDTEEEFNKYMEKKFRIYKSEKQMYMDFTGMDEETWNIWNGKGEEEE